jgi:hypothetical protein
MSTEDFPDFQCKHVQFYLAGKPGRPFMLQDIRFHNQAERLFVSGRASEAYTDRCFGRGFPVSIAWDAVEMYMVFDSAEQYHAETTRHETARRLFRLEARDAEESSGTS